MCLPNVQIVRISRVLKGTFAKKIYLAGTESTCGGLIMSQPIKVDIFNCANICLVVVLVRLPMLHCAVG